jgi:hypothetical protein
MTPDEFRELALNLGGVVESSHMNHPDFRAHGRIFATLGYPDTSTGMVKLPLPEQERMIDLHPQVFYPASGSWGLQGSTMVRLEAAKTDVIAHALELAWENSAAATPAKKAKKRARSAVSK